MIRLVPRCGQLNNSSYAPLCIVSGTRECFGAAATSAEHLWLLIGCFPTPSRQSLARPEFIPVDRPGPEIAGNLPLLSRCWRRRAPCVWLAVQFGKVNVNLVRTHRTTCKDGKHGAGPGPACVPGCALLCFALLCRLVWSGRRGNGPALPCLNRGEGRA